jgi:hypothetical protein
MKIENFEYVGLKYKALKITKDNVNDVEKFTNGEMIAKSFPEEKEIFLYRYKGSFWVNSGDYILISDKNVINIMSEKEYKLMNNPTNNIRKENMFDKFNKLLNWRVYGKKLK